MDGFWCFGLLILFLFIGIGNGMLISTLKFNNVSKTTFIFSILFVIVSFGMQVGFLYKLSGFTIFKIVISLAIISFKTAGVVVLLVSVFNYLVYFYPSCSVPILTTSSLYCRF